MCLEGSGNKHEKDPKMIINKNKEQKMDVASVRNEKWTAQFCTVTLMFWCLEERNDEGMSIANKY